MLLSQPLVSLLGAALDSDRVVAFGAGGTRTLADLLDDVFALAHAWPLDRGERWLVESEDAYQVAVTLLAASIVGARVVLPPNQQAGTLAGLRASSMRVIGEGGGVVAPLSPSQKRDAISDPLRQAAVEGNALPASHSVGNPGGQAIAADEAAARPVPIDRDTPLIDLYTSGTSGPGKLVTKSLRHVEDEVVELERVFGAGIPRDAAVLATVPAQHLYGLLFRVLWPLAFGRPFARTSSLMPEELLTRIAEADQAVIVSSPAHLRHLAASPRLAEQKERVAQVFSSGGPLETRTALDVASAVGRAPVEIFGSTETGGVAFRRASAADPSPCWRTFSPVSIGTDDGCLVVTSPFVTSPCTTGSDRTDVRSTWCMGDRIAMVGDGFRLLGRSDRIAKVGEKTLSLPEIEAHLATHPLVDAAIAGIFPGSGGPRLGAIVVLHPNGKRRLCVEGRRAVQALLADHLAGHWDRVVLPRRWRFRDALPFDARGKFSQQDFEAEFTRGVDEPLEPFLTGEKRDGDDIVFEFVVPRDLAYFDGHYDAFLLVPAVVQVHWVMTMLGRVLGRSVTAQRMEAVKFKNVMRPAQSFAMRLRVEAERVTFTLADGTRVFSSGRITLDA